MPGASGPFHLAFAVSDLESTRAFYGGLLGCVMGRSAPTWQDFDFFGHQLSAHVAPRPEAAGGEVDGKVVPIPHFGVVLDFAAWEALAGRLKAAGAVFLIEPEVRFAGEPGEQARFSCAIPRATPSSSRGSATGLVCSRHERDA